ncbi:MAG TPA: methyltransferase [Rhizomicrobium sp.]|nr:methyltransferase [Rhizomicrobium sp.]
MSIIHTQDRFLDGRVTVRQPVAGFRSGLDAVMLAAAVPAKRGTHALEMGSGAGVASLCLAARADCAVTGVELDAGLSELANANAAANHMEDRVHFIAGDALETPRDQFDHVFCNPPFHEGERSPDDARALALHDEGKLGDWLRAGMKRTASNGTFTIILRADRLGEALNALPHRGTTVLPLWPRAGEQAKRVIVQVRKGARTPLAFLHGLVLHESDGRYTQEADAILRGVRSIEMQPTRKMQASPT